MVDANRFKQINDRFGHAVGDDALRAIARALQSAVRETDVVGRLGGDEFAVILDDADLETAEEIAGRMRDLVASARLVTVHEPLTIGISVGLAAWQAPDETIDELLRRADAAMYSEKAAVKADVNAG